MDSISIKQATIINFISKYSNVFIQLILNGILARLLTPDDYGIVAVISVFTVFFTLIADMGIGPAIIQNKDLSKKDITSIFKFTVYSSIVISFLFVLFSILMVNFYQNKIYFPLGILMSISILFNVINIVPNAILMKDKRFKLVGIRTVCITLFCGIITVVLAYFNLKYYAIVINSILLASLTCCFNLFITKISIRGKISKKSLLKIYKYSTYQFGFSFINYFSRNLDNLLIGRYLGQQPLGYYDKAYKLVLYPVSNLTHVITPVLHPILSDYQNNRKYIYEQYTKIIKILSLIGVFITVYCFFASKEAILIMYGPQWVQSIDSFRILSITIWLQMISSSSGTIFQSLGETRALFKSGYITTSINVIGIIIGLFLGKIETISLMILFTFSINFIITFYILVKKVLKHSLKDFFKLFIPEIFISIIMSIALIIASKYQFSNVLISAVYKFIIAISSYFIGLFLTNQTNFLKNIIKKS